ncbi:hypothetical protein ABVK25_012396 [Lepraria finkii]|uniref:DUF7770 domain-containing protein n=1 Tax=Lepraria finkii TaxID=1340010 RepID=A0ABR4AM80_9LECA
MEWNRDAADDKGKFTVTKHAYAQTNSAVRVFDYDVASGNKVQSFLKTIGEKKKRQNYKNELLQALVVVTGCTTCLPIMYKF